WTPNTASISRAPPRLTPLQARCAPCFMLPPQIIRPARIGQREIIMEWSVIGFSRARHAFLIGLAITRLSCAHHTYPMWTDQGLALRFLARYCLPSQSISRSTVDRDYPK